MIIKFQNCNQRTRYIEDGTNKYDVEKDRLCSKNVNFYPKFYENILKDNPDVIILAEVAKAENIFNEIDKLKPNIYVYQTNSDLFFEYPNQQTMIQNKIMIIYNRSIFKLLGQPDESEYTKDGKIDYLHLTLQKIEDGENFDIFGIRVRSRAFISGLNKYSKDEQNRIIAQNREDNNKVNIFFENFLNKYENCKNFILAGDFNHGVISKYEKDNVQYSYNYQTLNQIVNKTGKYELFTKGVKVVGDIYSDTCEYYFNGIDWTFRKNVSPIDHFITSKNFANSDFVIMYDELGADLIYLVYGNKACSCGVPDHREIRLYI